MAKIDPYIKKVRLKKSDLIDSLGPQTRQGYLLWLKNKALDKKKRKAKVDG